MLILTKFQLKFIEITQNSKNQLNKVKRNLAEKKYHQTADKTLKKSEKKYAKNRRNKTIKD